MKLQGGKGDIRIFSLFPIAGGHNTTEQHLVISRFLFLNYHLIMDFFL